jgi:hypothetical protein
VPNSLISLQKIFGMIFAGKKYLPSRTRIPYKGQKESTPKGAVGGPSLAEMIKDQV